MNHSVAADAIRNSGDYVDLLIARIAEQVEVRNCLVTRFVFLDFFPHCTYDLFLFSLHYIIPTIPGDTRNRV